MPRVAELKLQQLQYLVAIAEHGGLRPTAQALGVTPAAVSKGLQELENTAGTRLFERQAQGLHLTQAARRLLTRARLIQAEVDQALLELDSARASNRIRFTVGITPWFSLTLLAPTLQRFSAMRPDVSLRLLDVFGTDYFALREGSMELAIGPAPPQRMGQDLSARPLFSFEQAIACRQGHACQQVRRLEQLAGQSWVLSHEMEQFESPLREFFLTHYGNPTQGSGHVHLYKSMHMTQMICHSDLLTVLPWPVIEACRDRFSFAALTLQDRLPTTVTCYVTRRNMPANGCVGDFIDAMMQALEHETAHAQHMHPRVLRSLDIVSSR